MILTSPTHVVFTYLVWRQGDDPPHRGDTYRDSAGNDWIIRGVAPQVILGGPETVGLTPWAIDLASDHGAYRIDPGSNLVPVRTWRSGLAWEGDVDHLEAVGFGNCLQRLPGPELVHGGNRWSWLYREMGETWQFMVGPRVEHRSGFHDPIFERTGENRQPLVEGDRWARIRPCIEAFQEGED